MGHGFGRGSCGCYWCLESPITYSREARRFLVRLGTVSPSIEPATMLHVVSHSDHPIKLTDWGFIGAKGSFHSFQLDWDAGELQNEEISSHGSSDLADRGAFFESGYVRMTEPLGAYAKSVMQTRPRLYFNSEMPYWRRGWIRLRLLFQPNYLAW